MSPEDFQTTVAFFSERVRMLASNLRIVLFDVPSESEAIDAGLPPAAVEVLRAPWWEAMIAEVLEAPRHCDGDADEDVLYAARAVIVGYLRAELAPQPPPQLVSSVC